MDMQRATVRMMHVHAQHTYGAKAVSTTYLARVKTAFAFFSLSPSHLFSIVEASTVRKVAPP